MNRFGKIVLCLLVLAGIAFGAMLRFGSPVAPPPSPGPPPAPPGALITPSGLALPVAGVRPAALYDSFGDPRGGGVRGHGALDIPAATGTPVLAAAAGTVEKLFESKDGGHTIYVRTPDGGTIHYYAHLDSYGVAERQPVRQGQQIATVGNTGSAAAGASHLHFEIKLMQPGERWWQGTNVNPYPMLAGVGDAR